MEKKMMKKMQQKNAKEMKKIKIDAWFCHLISSRVTWGCCGPALRKIEKKVHNQ